MYSRALKVRIHMKSYGSYGKYVCVCIYIYVGKRPRVDSLATAPVRASDSRPTLRMDIGLLVISSHIAAAVTFLT